MNPVTASKTVVTDQNAQLSDLVNLAEVANDQATQKLIAELQAKLAAATAAASQANAKAELNAAELRRIDLENACLNQVVGIYGSNVTSLPGVAGLDIHVASSVSQLAANLRASLNSSDMFGGPIAFIPVVLFPTPKDTGKPQTFTDRDGKPLRNMSMGRTIVNDSYASVTVVDPDTGKPRSISLTGMCVISAKMDTQSGDFADPTKLANRIDARIEREGRSNVAHPEDNVDAPAFIGYQQSAGAINRWRAELGTASVRQLSQEPAETPSNL